MNVFDNFPMKRYDHIRRAIERRRRELGYTQEALAQRVGKTQSTMNSKLRGKTGLDYEEAMTLLEFLGLPPAIEDDKGAGRQDGEMVEVRTWDDRDSAIQLIQEGMREMALEERQNLYCLLASFFRYRLSDQVIAGTLQALSKH